MKKPWQKTEKKQETYCKSAFFYLWNLNGEFVFA